MSIENLDKYDYFDLFLACCSFIISLIAPEFSIMLGATIYYLWDKDKNQKNISIKGLFFTLFVSFWFGYYLIPLLDSKLYHYDFRLVPAIGFILGLFGKLLLNYIFDNFLIFLKYILKKIKIKG